MLLSVLNSYAQNHINELFFNLPLESNRDNIYSSIKKYGFIEEKTSHTVSQNDKIVKTFYGYLDTKSSTNKLSDSTKIQLSTGSKSIESEKYYQNLLIIWSYYHFSSIKTAKKFYNDRKRKIRKITAYKPYHSKNYYDDIETGFSDSFVNSDNQFELSIEFKKEGKQFIVTQEYTRNEGEKKLKKKYIKKKELVFRNIDSKELYQYFNVEQVPITKRCKSKEKKTIECLKSSILRKISRNVDFDDFGLTSGKHRIQSSFIIDKNGEIINIKTRHDNEKLCKKIKESINETEIITPAIKNGEKVNFIISFPLVITID